MEIKLKDIKLTPVLESAKRLRISDSEYFGSKYTNYISNSRLRWINPEQNGTPELYKKGGNETKTTSLSLGSCVHQMWLQPDEFIMGEKCGKPTAKLGLVIDKIIYFRKKGLSIFDSINNACQIIDYYSKSIDKKRIKDIINKGLKYYLYARCINENNIILLPDKDREIALNCIKNLNNKQFTSIIRPIDLFGDYIESYNEDTILIDITGSYEDKTCALSLKMKADNWTIDPDNKIITLNDLKTTGHMLCHFMNDSFHKFHYERQMSLYIWMLLQYCRKEYGYNPEEWTVKCNIIAVETCLDNRAGVFSISQDLIDKGKKEFCRLLKMVAYYEMYGYDSKVNFI